VRVTDVDALLVELGAELEAARERLGITHAEMARRSGLSRRTLTYLLKAQRDPRLGTIEAAARAVGCRPLFFVAPDDAQSPNTTTRRAYDDLQAAAVRVICVVCSGEYDATAPVRPFVCASCRDTRAHTGREAATPDETGAMESQRVVPSEACR